MWYHYHVKGCYGIAILKFFRFQKSIVSLTIVPAIATYATLRELFKDIPMLNLRRAQTERKKGRCSLDLFFQVRAITICEQYIGLAQSHPT
jgi:hypothetical protein